MCNLKQLSTKTGIKVYFGALVTDSYEPKAVGPFGDGAFLRPGAEEVELVYANRQYNLAGFLSLA